MWINPKFKDQVEQPAPPQEQGRRLATFPRGQGAEMRVNLSEYQGKPFVSLRLWERDQAGAWWPVKGKGCSVRMAEAPGMIDALRAALGTADDDAPRQGPDDNARFINKGRPQRAPFDPKTLPGPTAAGGFDEFGGGGGVRRPGTAEFVRDRTVAYTHKRPPRSPVYGLPVGIYRDAPDSCSGPPRPAP